MAHVGEPVPQRRGGTDRRRGRIVQLVREASREGAERQEALALLERLLRALRAEEQPFEKMQRHREPLPHQLGEVVGSEYEEPRPYIGPQRVVVHLSDAVAQVGLKCSAIDAPVVGSIDLHVVAADPAEQGNRTLEKDVEPEGGFAFSKDPARLDRLDVP